jgi:hypothetical protein
VLSKLRDIFAKFEPDASYVNIFAYGNVVCDGSDFLSVKEIEFIRYGLHFEVDGQAGVLRSREYSDYKLAKKQVLPAKMLFQFTNFILLERIDRKKVHLDKYKVLMPEGWVCLGTSGLESTPINATALQDTSLTSAVMDMIKSDCLRDQHNRAFPPSSLLQRSLDWRSRPYLAYGIKEDGAPLQGQNLAAWLQLACLYSICDSPFPEESSGKFPYQVALDIVRKSTTNRLLDSFELYKVNNLLDVLNRQIGTCAHLGYRTQGARLANVKLLAQNFIKLASHLEFCYANKVRNE